MAVKLDGALAPDGNCIFRANPANLPMPSTLPIALPSHQEVVHRPFVSYSRIDRHLVEPIVRVIRSAGPAVFYDLDSIPFGKLWRPVVEKNLDHASVVLVFWSQHSSRSSEVESEWRRALDLGTDLVPILLDDAALPPELAAFNGVDLRALAAEAVRDPGASITAGSETSSRIDALATEGATKIARLVRTMHVNLGKSSNPQVEQTVLAEVGSYGRQIGRIAEALEVVIGSLNDQNLTVSEKRALMVFLADVAAVNEIKARRVNGA